MDDDTRFLPYFMAGLVGSLLVIGLVAGGVMLGRDLFSSTSEATTNTTVPPPTDLAGQSTGTAVEAPPPVQLTPVSATATNERAPVPQLRCGGSNSFEAALLIDGIDDTGWGASSGDGTGESATVDFGQPVTLSHIGLSPGYLRVAPRSDQDCEPVLAFEFNRFVARVRYHFDDGSTIDQAFELEPEIQYTVVDVTTQTVRIEILATEATNDDDDTIISEAVFFGPEG